MKLTNKEDYELRAKNGARVLFNVGAFRLLDCSNDELDPEDSYFLIRFNDDEHEADTFFLLTLEECYEWYTYFHMGDRELLTENLFNHCFGCIAAEEAAQVV